MRETLSLGAFILLLAVALFAERGFDEYEKRCGVVPTLFIGTMNGVFIKQECEGGS